MTIIITISGTSAIFGIVIAVVRSEAFKSIITRLRQSVRQSGHRWKVEKNTEELASCLRQAGLHADKVAAGLRWRAEHELQAGKTEEAIQHDKKACCFEGRAAAYKDAADRAYLHLLRHPDDR